MPVNHAAVKARQATATADFGELGTIKATYHRSLLTPQFLQHGVELKEGEGVTMSDVRFLAQALISWDYEEKPGKPMKTDEATLATLPVDILAGVVRAIIEDLRPPATPATPSPGSF
jgi:hypothetical protein